MDSNDMKQIIIGYYATKDACKAMLKPIRTNLSDAETVASMPDVQQRAIEYIQIDCESIQRSLGDMESEISELEDSIFNDGEVKEARKMISDILFDIQPIENTLANHMTNEAIGAANRPAAIERLK